MSGVAYGSVEFRLLLDVDWLRVGVWFVQVGCFDVEVSDSPLASRGNGEEGADGGLFRHVRCGMIGVVVQVRLHAVASD